MLTCTDEEQPLEGQAYILGFQIEFGFFDRLVATPQQMIQVKESKNLIPYIQLLSPLLLLFVFQFPYHL